MKNLFVMVLIAATLAACGQKADDKKEPQKTGSSEESKSLIPDVGKVELVSVAATGVGVTPAAAANEALKSAIVQVNGVSISSASLQTNFGLQVVQSSSASSSNTVDTVKGQAFEEQIVQQSKGNIKEFKVISTDGPDAKGSYTVKIEAKIAKFKAPADAGKIKIVIAPLKAKNSTFNFAGEQVPSDQVMEGLRQRIIDALSQTGRFTILDRQFDTEVQGELDMIASGKSPDTDLAKIGQALSADLIWVGVINNFSYDKHVRKLQTSDRDLVSFTGGWSVSQRLVNVATKQILLSTTLDGKAPSGSPTTLGASVDKDATLRTMETDIVNQATEAILFRTFPVSVVDLDGMTVVLSQGGKSLIPNSRYKVFVLGKDLKDPQTGQSLGRMEKYCCDVVIDRVTPTTSYGTLENVKVSLEGIKADSLQIREAVPSKGNDKNSDEQKGSSETPKVGKSGANSRSSTGTPKDVDSVKSVVKDKEW